MIAPNSKVRVNLAGLRVGTVTFSGAVTDALGTVIRQSMEDPPTYLVKLLFSFKGVSQVEVSEDRLKPI